MQPRTFLTHYVRIIHGYREAQCQSSEPMNPTHHRPVEVELVPTNFSHSLEHVKNVFKLRMRYSRAGPFPSYRLVFTPESLQAALLSRDIGGIHLETFNYGSRAPTSAIRVRPRRFEIPRKPSGYAEKSFQIE